MGLVPRVLRELEKTGMRDLDRARIGAVDHDSQLAAAVDCRVRTPGLVLDLDRAGGRCGAPRTLGRAAGKDFLRRRHHPRAGYVARPQRLERLQRLDRVASLVRVVDRLADRLLGGRVVALAELVPAQRAAGAPEEQRGPAATTVVLPHQVLGVDGDGMLDAQALDRVPDGIGRAGEGEARRVGAEHAQTPGRVALAPGEDVGEGPDAVELGEVEEVDQDGRGGDQALHNGLIATDPDQARRQRRCGDVCSLRSQLAARMAECAARPELGQ